MKVSEKILGIEFAYQQIPNEGREEEQLEMIRALGIRWMRIGVSFPWKDRMFGELSENYLKAKKQIEENHRYGFQIMPATPGLGAYRYDEKSGKTVWMDSYPDFAGVKGTEAFYENVRKTMAFICEDLGDAAGLYWQCMNEIDIEIFSGDYSDEVAAQTARASAEGIMRANPKARCGINLSQYNERALKMADLVYAPGHCFAYIGDDQYFGSWQPGDVERWPEVIDALYERYHLPVLANEWGYSSGGLYSTEHIDPKILPKGLPEECYRQRWFYQAKGGHTEEAQARYLREGLQIFAENPHCIGSFIFCWRDAYRCYHCGGESCPSEDFWGIVTKDLKKKPAYNAVKEAIAAYYV